MPKQYQPLTLQVTTSPRRLRAQLLAAWPATPNAIIRQRAIKTITRHIKDTLPADYNGDISVFVSNEASVIHEPGTQGFLYHLTSQQIVTRQPVKKANNTALLHVHFTAAQSAEESEEELKNAETTPISRIQQIKQWQKETVKAMFQAMADTAISMESQTALRGTMAGLNKLGALLNKAVAAQKLPQSITKVTAQKSASRDIASTLSDLRSNLSLAIGNGLKPPTKSQLALRQQLNKLDKITPRLQKTAVKTVPIAKSTVKSSPVFKSAAAAKSVPATKTVMPIKTSSIARTLAGANSAPKVVARMTAAGTQSITQRINIKVGPVRVAHISIAPLRLTTVAKTFVAPRLATQGIPIRVLPRRVVTPARLITNIAQRIALPVTAAPTQRYVATATKTIIQKIAQRPALPKNTAATSQILSIPTRTTPRFQISRPIIARLRVTPTIITAHQQLRAPNTPVEQKTKTESVKQEKQSPQQSNPPRDITPKDTKTIVATAKVALQPNIMATQSLGSKIPLRNTRAPAVYAVLSPIITPLHQATLTHSQPVVAAVTRPAYVQRSAPQAPSLPPVRAEAAPATLVPTAITVAAVAPVAPIITETAKPTPLPPIPPTTLPSVEARTTPIQQPEKPRAAPATVIIDKPVETPRTTTGAKPDNKAIEAAPIPAKASDTSPPTNPTPTATPRTEAKPIELVAALPVAIQPPVGLPVSDASPPPPPNAQVVTPSKTDAARIDVTPTGQPPSPIQKPLADQPMHAETTPSSSNIVHFEPANKGEHNNPTTPTPTHAPIIDNVISMRDRLPKSRTDALRVAWENRERNNSDSVLPSPNAILPFGKGKGLSRPNSNDDDNPAKVFEVAKVGVCIGSAPKISVIQAMRELEAIKTAQRAIAEKKYSQRLTA